MRVHPGHPFRQDHRDRPAHPGSLDLVRRRGSIEDRVLSSDKDLRQDRTARRD